MMISLPGASLPISSGSFAWASSNVTVADIVHAPFARFPRLHSTAAAAKSAAFPTARRRVDLVPVAHRNSPEPGYRIGIERRIRTDNRNPLDDGLGDKQSVKRVFVVERQTRQGRRV